MSQGSHTIVLAGNFCLRIYSIVVLSVLCLVFVIIYIVNCCSACWISWKMMLMKLSLILLVFTKAQASVYVAVMI